MPGQFRHRGVGGAGRSRRALVYGILAGAAAITLANLAAGAAGAPIDAEDRGYLPDIEPGFNPPLKGGLYDSGGEEDDKADPVGDVAESGVLDPTPPSYSCGKFTRKWASRDGSALYFQIDRDPGKTFVINGLTRTDTPDDRIVAAKGMLFQYNKNLMWRDRDGNYIVQAIDRLFGPKDDVHRICDDLAEKGRRNFYLVLGVAFGGVGSIIAGQEIRDRTRRRKIEIKGG